MKKKYLPIYLALAITCYSCKEKLVDPLEPASTSKVDTTDTIAVAVSDTVLDVESTGVSELSDELDVEPTRQVIETDVPDAKPESEVLAATPSHSQPSSARPAVTEEATEDTDNSRSNTNNDARASDTTVTATESSTLGDAVTLPTLDDVTEPQELEQVMSIDHEAFEKLLQQYVDEQGFVDYAAWQRNTSDLDIYLSQLSVGEPSPQWDKNEALAYWINLYNAYTIKLILDNYPLASITDLHNGKPWDIKWIAVGDRKLSLNNVENDIIRPQFDEPRIHFAVNCAAKSCPPLANEAFTSQNMESLLTARTEKFVNNATYNNLSATAVKISKIFEWYAEDFGDLPAFLTQFANMPIAPTAVIEYQAYDWSLNNR